MVLQSLLETISSARWVKAENRSQVPQQAHTLLALILTPQGNKESSINLSTPGFGLWEEIKQLLTETS